MSLPFLLVAFFSLVIAQEPEAQAEAAAPQEPQDLFKEVKPISCLDLVKKFRATKNNILVAALYQFEDVAEQKHLDLIKKSSNEFGKLVQSLNHPQLEIKFVKADFKTPDCAEYARHHGINSNPAILIGREGTVQAYDGARTQEAMGMYIMNLFKVGGAKKISTPADKQKLQADEWTPQILLYSKDKKQIDAFDKLARVYGMEWNFGHVTDAALAKSFNFKGEPQLLSIIPGYRPDFVVKGVPDNFEDMRTWLSGLAIPRIMQMTNANTYRAWSAQKIMFTWLDTERNEKGTKDVTHTVKTLAKDSKYEDVLFVVLKRKEYEAMVQNFFGSSDSVGHVFWSPKLGKPDEAKPPLFPQNQGLSVKVVRQWLDHVLSTLPPEADVKSEEKPDL